MSPDPHKTKDTPVKTNVLIVTGLSGAGKTSALKCFEDMGYEAVDNLPLTLLTKLIRTVDDNPDHDESRPLALGVDTRTRAFKAENFLREVENLKKKKDIDLSLLFFDCSDTVLVRRFSETRRRHPLSQDRPAADGIAKERDIMTPLRMAADVIVDTTDLTVHDMRRRLRDDYVSDRAEGLTITCASFAYGRGLPRDADIVFDVRFLRNPHYDEKLRPYSGRDEAVAAFIAADPDFDLFFSQLSSLLLGLLPRYQKEGKSYLTFATGCTGGRHRSVFVTEMLAKLLEKNGFQANIIHRDIEQKN